MKSDFVLVGGDMRMCHAVRFLGERGYRISAFANSAAGALPGVTLCTSVEDATQSSDKILFGIPFAKNGEISAPLCNQKISPDDFLKYVEPHHTIIGGMLGDFKCKFEEKGAFCADYGLREDFCLLNAVPTVEAVIAILIEKLPVTLWGSKILVMGYGRIGKLLSDRLSALGADVTVTARRSTDFALARIKGVKCERTDSYINNGNGYRAVINTIPKKILTEKSFSCLSRECLVVDVSSYPGYVSQEEGALHGVEVMGAFSLPGKSSPVTAGRIIADVAENIVSEQH